MPMPMALDHINVYLLREDDGWTLVDTGLNLPRTRELWEQIVATQLEGLPVKRLVCTHCHYDHAGVAAWLCARYQIPLLMTYGEFFMLRGLMGPPPDPLPESLLGFYQRAGMGQAQVGKMFEALRRDPFMPPVPESYQRLRAGDVLTIGTRDWQVIIGEGHSPEHACLYNASERILIAGDQLLPRISSNVLVSSIEPEANPLQLWLASLDRLDVLAPDTLVLPSHQSVFRGLHARVAELHAHHQQQFELLRTELGQRGSATALELMQVQFPKLRGAMDELMALGETLAHLAWLRYEGQIGRVLEDDACHRFSLMSPPTGVSLAR
ncbi:MBL fold metallo-hydrolase [Rhodoferax lacus]|uniref:MBL fold metallo-hydrolase n=2 Tax=Rhodoferax lacus TaxID=2184758 RepID=A0A3E1R9S1_9BURK|nr:MBL fold metallo-hydrolase [Rhodoferax lacus]